MKKIFVIALASILFSPCVVAETYVLDLEKSIEIAKEKSFDMLRLKQSLKIAEYNLKSATSKFKTQIDMDLVVPSINRAITPNTNDQGITTLQKTNYTRNSGTLNITQPLPTDGKISIESSISNRDDYQNDKRSSQLFTSIQLTQPINSLFGYNNIKAQYKQSILAYEQSQKSMKREELNLTYSVTDAFFRMISVQKRKELAGLNLDRQKEAYTIAKNKFDAGLIKEVDALQMEVDLAAAQNDYDLAQVNQSSTMNSFKDVLGLLLTDSVTLSSELTYKVVIIDPKMAVDLAMKNRLEIRDQEINIELAKLKIKETKAEGMVKGNLIANIQKTGSNGSQGQALSNSLKSTFNTSATDFTSNRTPDYVIGLNIKIPILDWGDNRAQVNKTRAMLQQNLYTQEETKRTIEREVLNLVEELNSSLKRLQLLEKNVLIAVKSFEITRQRFSDGNIDSQALALERERLNGAYNSHLSAYINYQLMLADIMRKTFFDFQRDKSIN